MTNPPAHDELQRRLLPGLLAEMDRVQRVRRARRRAWGSAACVLLAGAAWWTIAPRPAPSPTPAVARTVPASWRIPTDPRLARAWSIPTDPSVIAAFRTAAPHAPIERLSDDALLAFLASIGRPTGLAHFDGGVALTRDVTDPLGPG